MSARAKPAFWSRGRSGRQSARGTTGSARGAGRCRDAIWRRAAETRPMCAGCEGAGGVRVALCTHLDDDDLRAPPLTACVKSHDGRWWTVLGALAVCDAALGVPRRWGAPGQILRVARGAATLNATAAARYRTRAMLAPRA